jgi:hypothetical protein
MEAITFLTTLSLALSGSGSKTAAAVVGTWRMQVPAEVRELSRKMGLPEPQAEFTFNTDSTFSYSAVSGKTSKSFSGNYAVSEGKVHLAAATSGWPGGALDVSLNDGKDLNVDGLIYTRGGGATIAGTWLLRSGTGFDTSTKIVFKADETFVFTGSFATSKGKYQVSGNQVTLLWTEVDGEKISVGSMHKTVNLDDSGTLHIDDYRYGRQ